MTAEKNQAHGSSIISGMLLIAGTCIGAGMLALPVVTGEAGFYPGMFVNILCWLFMLATGLLFLEATLWMKKGSNVLSMANRFLGTRGKWLGGASFLFLYYCLMVAYIAGGAPLFANIIERVSGLSLHGYFSYFIFAAVFAVFVFLGTRFVDRMNWILMIGLIVSYFMLVAVGSTEINLEYLQHQSWTLSLFAMPVLFGAYGYHNVVPSVATYMKHDAKKIRLAVILGTTIPFVVYSLWQWIIIGSIPLEEIHKASDQGVPITHTLQTIVGHPWISRLGMFFGFFALVTSLLGVALSMVDFLADGIGVHVSHSNIKRLMLCLAVFLPPTIFAMQNPDIFIEAIGFAGGFGEAILNGLFPIAMVWVGRYHLKLPSQISLPGGRPLLVLLGLFTLFIMGLELVHILQK